MTVKERLKEFVKYKKISIREFERLSGLNYGYINAIRVSIQPDKIKSIASYFTDLNTEWLMTGEGEMLKKIKHNEAKEVDPSYMDVELVSKYAYAGYLSGYGDAEYVESLPKIPVVVDHEGHGNYKCFEVRGDSMNDETIYGYMDGDVILAREVQRGLWRPKLHINKVDFIIVHKDGIVLKQIIEQCDVKGVIKLHSLNPNKIDYPDYEIFLDDCYQIFSVVEIVKRNMKR